MTIDNNQFKRPDLNPYKVLTVDRNADQTEIKSAYFDLVEKHPPEEHPDQFKKIQEAYELLKEPEKRIKTDLLLLKDPPEAPGSPDEDTVDSELDRNRTLDLLLRLLVADVQAEDYFQIPD